MDLSPRKKTILAELVKAHIEYGEPIGSKLLAERLENSPSSATLRNEMSELCDLGYLEQPHTSAGRIPTAKAYRLYVTEFMDKTSISEEGKQVIDDMLSQINPDPENIGLAAAQILTELTGLPSISVASTTKEVTLKKATLFPMGKTSAIVFVITDDGRARSRFVHTSSPITPSLLTKFDNIAQNKLCGIGISNLDTVYLQGIVASSGLEALSLAPFISCAFEMAADISKNDIRLNGAANIFSLCQGETEARRIIELLSGRDTIRNIFNNISGPVGIIFGDDTAYTELKPTGMIVASYGDDQELGRLAVIGPTRMSYEKILPSIEYLSNKIGNIMTEVLKGLEE